MGVLEKLAAVNSWINNRLAFIVRHGSHAYGTNIETSDDDFKGVAISPKEYYLGFVKGFEQQELKDPDTCVYEIRKFFKLAAAANPNVIEILYTNKEDHILVNPVGERIFDARDKFLSKRIRYTFAGYARSQLNRLELHYRWLKDPPKTMPTRFDFDLPAKTLIPENQFLAIKSMVNKEIESYNIGYILDDLREDQTIAIQNAMQDILTELRISKEDMWTTAAHKVGFDDNFISYMQVERAYENKKREWNQFNDWKKNRNPSRATLEEKYGYDCKHAYHLVRLLRMSREILETGKVIVKRPDREELLAIRNGAWSYNKLIEFAKTEDSKLDEICAKSKAIPDKPDMIFLDRLCTQIVEEVI